jgi:hypothetical protein
VKPSFAAAGTGLSGSVGAMLVAPGGSLTVIGVALVTGVSCLFGMLSSASRIQIAPGLSATRVVLMNGGAVWIAAFSLAAFTEAKMASAALIGLGVGLAGTKALEVIEAGAVALAQRVSGKQPVTREEMQQMIGDVRNDTQAVVSDINVRTRKRLRERGEASDD